MTAGVRRCVNWVIVLLGCYCSVVW
jgi:hypothetical protein